MPNLGVEREEMFILRPRGVGKSSSALEECSLATSGKVVEEGD